MCVCVCVCVWRVENLGELHALFTLLPTYKCVCWHASKDESVPPDESDACKSRGLSRDESSVSQKQAHQNAHTKLVRTRMHVHTHTPTHAPCLFRWTSSWASSSAPADTHTTTRTHTRTHNACQISQKKNSALECSLFAD